MFFQALPCYGLGHRRGDHRMALVFFRRPVQVPAAQEFLERRHAHQAPKTRWSHGQGGAWVCRSLELCTDKRDTRDTWADGEGQFFGRGCHARRLCSDLSTVKSKQRPAFHPDDLFEDTIAGEIWELLTGPMFTGALWIFSTLWRIQFLRTSGFRVWHISQGQAPLNRFRACASRRCFFFRRFPVAGLIGPNALKEISTVPLIRNDIRCCGQYERPLAGVLPFVIWTGRAKQLQMGLFPSRSLWGLELLQWDAKYNGDKTASVTNHWQILALKILNYISARGRWSRFPGPQPAVPGSTGVYSCIFIYNYIYSMCNLMMPQVWVRMKGLTSLPSAGEEELDCWLLFPAKCSCSPLGWRHLRPIRQETFCWMVRGICLPMLRLAHFTKVAST